MDYKLMQLPMEQLQACRQQEINSYGIATYGVPLYFARWPEGGIETYPLFRTDEGRVDIRGDEVFYVPTPKAEPRSSDLLAELSAVTKEFIAKSAPIYELPAYLERALDGVQAAQRKEHPAQMPDDEFLELLRAQDVTCGICGQRGLHACAPPPAHTLIGSSPDPIVDMIEFKGRLWVATTKGVFVKRENEDAFDQVEMIPAPEPVGEHVERQWYGNGRDADEAAGLVPLHPRQTADRADPFVPNKFGEH